MSREFEEFHQVTMVTYHDKFHMDVIGSSTVMTSAIVARVLGSIAMHCSANSLIFLFHINAICRSLSSGFGVWFVHSSQRSTPKLYTSICLGESEKKNEVVVII